MAIRETLRDMRNLEITAQKKTEKKQQFENLIYKQLKKEFDNTKESIDFTYMELLKNKDLYINNLTPPGLTLYEASKIYNKILNELYKENKIDKMPIYEDEQEDEQAQAPPQYFKKWLILNAFFIPLYIILYILSIIF